MSHRVLLVRHTPVARAWSGRCYGRSDMGLSRAGTASMRVLAEELAAQSFRTIVHSGAIRTRVLAERIATLTARPIATDPRWLERDFGNWEGRRWHAIWRETGDLMDRMMTDPAGFHPGGGESGQDLTTRVRAAWDALPTTGDTLVVSHGGPIAALRTLLAGDPMERMIDAVPACGSWHVLPRETPTSCPRRQE